MTRADQRKHHYIYKITRIDNSGKYYIGMHSTDNLDDGYFGSGTLLWHSIKKHGKEKHIKEILEFLPSRKELNLREKELITKELLSDELCMNIVPGGTGGSDVGRLGAEGLKRKRLDPEFEAKYQERMLEVGAKFRERRLSDPAFQKKISDASLIAAAKKKQRRLDDPEYDRMLYEKLSKAHLGLKDSEQTKANKRAAQALVTERDLPKKQASAAKARETLSNKSSEEVSEMKRKQSEGALRLAQSLKNDPARWAAIVKKKRSTREINGTNILSKETKLKLSKANSGKKRSPEVIQRMKERTGDKSSTSGTVWMKLGGARKRVKSELIRFHEDQGYVHGKV